MRRGIIGWRVVLAGMAATAALTVPPAGAAWATSSPSAADIVNAASSAKAPVLATSWASSQQGFGTVRPKTIFNGGDATGLVRRITWSSWGGSTAKGRGEACYVAPGQTASQCRMTRVTVVATRLGSCAGKRAYEDVGWYFPTKKQTQPRWDVRKCLYGSRSSTPVMGGPKYYPDTSMALVGPGKVRPARIQLNGETSGFTRLRWDSWGGGSAVAHGTDCGEGYECGAVTVRLSDSGTCSGARAYRDASATEEGSTFPLIRDCRLV